MWSYVLYRNIDDPSVETTTIYNLSKDEKPGSESTMSLMSSYNPEYGHEREQSQPHFSTQSARFDHSFGMDDQPEPRFAFSLPDLSRKPLQPEPPFGSKKTDEVGKDAFDWAKRNNPFGAAGQSASTFGQDANKENASGNFFPKMGNQNNGLNETTSFNNGNDNNTNNNNADLEEQHSGFLGYCAYFLRRYVD